MRSSNTGAALSAEATVQLLPAGTNPTRFAERGSRRAFTAVELQALGDALNEAEAGGIEHPSAILAVRLLA